MTKIQQKEITASYENISFMKNYRVHMTHISVFLLALLNGCNMSWTSPMISKLNGTDDNPLGRVLTVDESSWLASITILGTIIGSLIYGALGEIFGRKSLITSIGVPFVIFYVTMPFVQSIWYYLFGRFISGISGGGVLTIIPMYIGEMAKPEARGRYFVLIAVANALGNLVTYSTAPSMSFFWFHICFAVLPLVFLILFPIFALESPYYTIQKDPVQAEELLKILRERNDVTEEFNRIKMGLNKTSDESLITVLRTKATRKALVISIGLASSFMLSGCITINVYTQLIFESAGGAWSPEVNLIVFSVVQVFFTIVSSTVMDRFARKPLLGMAFGVLSFSELILGIYLILKYNGTDVSSVMKWLPLLGLMIFVAALSFACIAPSISGELFPLKAKSIAMTIASVYGGLLGFLTTFLFQKIEIAIGLGQTFLIFAGFSACSMIFMFTVMIETKGKTLVQIQEDLDGMEKKRNNEKI